MIERRAEFIRELDSLCENIVNCGELNYENGRTISLPIECFSGKY